MHTHSLKTPRAIRYWRLALCLLLVVTPLLIPPPASRATPAAPVLPPRNDVFSDDFNGGSLATWSTAGSPPPYLASGSGRGGSTALAVPVNPGTSTASQYDVSRA